MEREKQERAGLPREAKTAPDPTERLLRAISKAQRTGDWSRVRLLMIEDLARLAFREGATRPQLVAWETLWRKVGEQEAEAAPPGVTDGFGVGKPHVFPPLGRKTVKQILREEEEGASPAMTATPSNKLPSAFQLPSLTPPERTK